MACNGDRNAVSLLDIYSNYNICQVNNACMSYEPTHAET